MRTSDKTTDVCERLVALLEQATDGAVRADAQETGPGSIRRLGVSSVAMLEFLVLVEDEFGIEWDDDVDEAVFDSFDAMVVHIVTERGQ